MRAPFAGCLAFLVGALCFAGQPAESAPSQPTLTEAPADQALEGLAVVTIRYPKEAHFAGWQLAHKLAFGARGARFIKRFYWHSLARAFESVSLTPEGKVESRVVGKEQILIAKVEEAGGIKATLYLPERLVQPLEGKCKLEALTSLTRTRNTTQEVTTWPTKLKLNYSDELAEDRTFEWGLVYNHSLVLNKTRPALRDEDGHIIFFRNLKATRVQDTRDAALEASYLFGVGHGTRLGRVDAGVVGGLEWAQDKINFLDHRYCPYVGANLRFSSEQVDDQRLELGLRLGGTLERFTIVDPIFNEDGNQIGSTTTIEKNQLATWELTTAWRVPLYRLDNFPLMLLDGQASWAQSFEKAGAGSGHPAINERIARADVGVTFQTPMGAAARFGAKLTWNRLPGEAGKKIEDLQLSYGFSAAFKTKL